LLRGEEQMPQLSLSLSRLQPSASESFVRSFTVIGSEKTSLERLSTFFIFASIVSGHRAGAKKQSARDHPCKRLNGLSGFMEISNVGFEDFEKIF
jgi:hypothetical protein